jgi:hypothetical protein
MLPTDVNDRREASYRGPVRPRDVHTCVGRSYRIARRPRNRSWRAAWRGIPGGVNTLVRLG